MMQSVVKFVGLTKYFFYLVQGAFINDFMQEEICVGGGTFVPLIKVWAKQPFFMTNGGCVLYKNTQ